MDREELLEILDINSDIFVDGDLIYISSPLVGHYNMIPIENLRYVTSTTIDDKAYMVLTFTDEFLLSVGVSKYLACEFDEITFDRLVEYLRDKEE